MLLLKMKEKEITWHSGQDQTSGALKSYVDSIMDTNLCTIYLFIYASKLCIKNQSQKLNSLHLQENWMEVLRLDVYGGQVTQVE